MGQGRGKIIPSPANVVFSLDTRNRKNYISGSGTMPTQNNTHVVTPTIGVDIVNNVFTFDGDEDFIKIDYNRDFLLDGSNPFSMCLWYRNDSLNLNQLLLTNISGGQHGIQFFLSDMNEIQTNLQGGNPPNDNLWVHTDTDAITTTNEWNHLAFTYDGSTDASGLRLFKNSIVQPRYIEHNSLTSSIANTNDFSINGPNGYLNVSGSYSSGSMNEILIYDKQLSQTELAEIYNTTRNRYGR